MLERRCALAMSYARVSVLALEPPPADDAQPSRHERIALQRRLSALGYKVADLEGHLDFEMRDAVRELQVRFGMVPDGHPSRAFLDRADIQMAR